MTDLIVPTFILFSAACTNLQYYKSNYHHYCGFFSSEVLPAILSDNIVSINNYRHTLTTNLIINYSDDGVDTIITASRLLVTSKEYPLGSIINNSEGRAIGVISSTFKHSELNCYPIQDGFKNLNIHLTKLHLQYVDKISPIYYAGHHFNNKTQLVNYINSDKPRTELLADLVLFSGGSQLTVYQDGYNIINQHFRLETTKNLGSIDKFKVE